jgi:hypothetical protein
MGKKYMNRVAELGCSLCQVIGYGPTPAEVHHLREGVGMAQRNSNFLTIPLCPEHHRGASGVHGDRSALKNARQDEMSLLAWTIEALNG